MKPVVSKKKMLVLYGTIVTFEGSLPRNKENVLKKKQILWA